MEQTKEPPNLCPACGTRFTCGMTAGDTTCWCASLPPLLAVPTAPTTAACYCPACLRRMLAAQPDRP